MLIHVPLPQSNFSAYQSLFCSDGCNESNSRVESLMWSLTKVKLAALLLIKDHSERNCSPQWRKSATPSKIQGHSTPHLACTGSRPLKSAHEGPHYENQRLMHADRPSPTLPHVIPIWRGGGRVSVDMETYGTVWDLSTAFFVVVGVGCVCAGFGVKSASPSLLQDSPSVWEGGVGGSNSLSAQGLNLQSVH